MTKLGKTTTKITQGMDRLQAASYWQEASRAYAQAAVTSGQKSVHVFINMAKYSTESIWATIEQPILKGLETIYHFI